MGSACAFSAIVLGLAFLGAIPGHAAEKQLIAGAGPSTNVVRWFVEAFSKTAEGRKYDFEVPLRSTKHAGGIASSNRYVFGRTGRPLNEAEKKNKGEIFLARIPITFAVGSDVHVSELTLDQLERIYTGEVSNWKQVGGTNAPILLVGREPTEAVLSVLEKDHPFFGAADYSIVAKKDHHVVSFLKSKRGRHALGFGAQPNFTDVPIVEVKGYHQGVDVGLVYDLKNAEHSLVSATQDFVASEHWRRLVRSKGLSPPD